MSKIDELRRLLDKAATVELDECVGIDMYEPRWAYLPEHVEPLLEALPALLEAAERAQYISDGWFGNGFDPAGFHDLRAALERLA